MLALIGIVSSLRVEVVGDDAQLEWQGAKSGIVHARRMQGKKWGSFRRSGRPSPTFFLRAPHSLLQHCRCIMLDNARNAMDIFDYEGLEMCLIWFDFSKCTQHLFVCLFLMSDGQVGLIKSSPSDIWSWRWDPPLAQQYDGFGAQKADVCQHLLPPPHIWVVRSAVWVERWFLTWTYSCLSASLPSADVLCCVVWDFVHFFLTPTLFMTHLSQSYFVPFICSPICTRNLCLSERKIVLNLTI